jgi:hypothetical protein
MSKRYHHGYRKKRSNSLKLRRFSDLLRRPYAPFFGNVKRIDTMAAYLAKLRRQTVEPYRLVQLPKELSREVGGAMQTMLGRLAHAASGFVWLSLFCLISAGAAKAQQNGAAPAQSSTNVGSGLASAKPAVGKLRVLVVPALWSDDKGGEPVTLARIAELMNMVRVYYLEASYGQLEIVPTVTPWIRLSVPLPGGCPNVAAAQAAFASPAIASYRAAGLDRIVVIQPRVADQCFWHGIASGASVWINGVFDEKVIGHELGHTLGLGHAHQLNCGAEAAPLVLRGCRVVVTGDFYALMGKWSMGDLMAMHKAQLGWITPVTHGGGVAEYDLTAISAKGGKLYAVKVVRGARTFWIERREPGGLDAKIPSAGISIRVVDGSIGCGESCILNMSANGDDFLSGAALQVGQKWSDSGMTIEVIRAGRIKVTTP